MVNRIKAHPPQRCPGPAPQTWEYATLHDKRNFASVIKLRILREGDYPGLSSRAQWNHKNPYKTMAEGQSQRDIWKYYIAGFEDGGMGHETRNAGGL